MFYRNVSSLFRLVIIVFFLAVFSSAQAGEGKPIAVIEADTYNFGEVYERTDVIANFIVKNTGDDDLEILKVKTKKWGCTSVSFDRLISPGSEGKITIEFSTKGRAGKINRDIRVETNDPDNSKFKLKLTGQVNGLVIITPSKKPLTQAFISGTVGEKISKVVALVQDDDEPLQILSTNSLNKGDFRYKMEEIEIDGKKAYQFVIENTRMTAGRYLDKIFIFTDSIIHNPLTIKVNGDIRAPRPENKEAGN